MDDQRTRRPYSPHSVRSRPSGRVQPRPYSPPRIEWTFRRPLDDLPLAAPDAATVVELRRRIVSGIAQELRE